jgi:hypothetical protein
MEIDPAMRIPYKQETNPVLTDIDFQETAGGLAHSIGIALVAVFVLTGVLVVAWKWTPQICKWLRRQELANKANFPCLHAVITAFEDDKLL